VLFRVATCQPQAVQSGSESGEIGPLQRLVFSSPTHHLLQDGLPMLRDVLSKKMLRDVKLPGKTGGRKDRKLSDIAHLKIRWLTMPAELKFGLNKFFQKESLNEK
jgi:hypothetical protein